MKKDIETVTLSIKQALSDYSSGKLSFENARELYLKLYKQYQNLQNTYKASYEKKTLKGICYSHNIENFSIISGIYELFNDTFTPIVFHGNVAINKKIVTALYDEISIIQDFGISKIALSKKNSGNQNIIYSHISDFNGRKIYFISLSTSNFFSDDKFYFYSELLKNIFSIVQEKQRPVIINYYGGIVSEIKTHISQKMNNKKETMIFFYYFKQIEEIFLHKGIRSVLRVSHQIIDTLYQNFPAQSHVVAPSFSEYLVIASPSKELSDINYSKLDFMFEGVNIRSHALKLESNALISAYSHLNEIYSFENNISSGR